MSGKIFYFPDSQRFFSGDVIDIVLHDRAEIPGSGTGYYYKSKTCYV